MHAALGQRWMWKHTWVPLLCHLQETRLVLLIHYRAFVRLLCTQLRQSFEMYMSTKRVHIHQIVGVWRFSLKKFEINATDLVRLWDEWLPFSNFELWVFWASGEPELARFLDFTAGLLPITLTPEHKRLSPGCWVESVASHSKRSGEFNSRRKDIKLAQVI